MSDAEYQRAYYARNRDRLRAYHKARYVADPSISAKAGKAWRERLKQKVFEAYGNRCACCAEENPRFLSVDHVNGGGRAHRRSLGGAGKLYSEIIRQGFPSDYQVLCFNCNLGRALNEGVCPHRENG